MSLGEGDLFVKILLLIFFSAFLGFCGVRLVFYMRVLIFVFGFWLLLHFREEGTHG